jgi:hypothetical protein
MKQDFPYPYYFYGSHDSQDADVLIQIPSDMMPVEQEERKRLMKRLEEEWELSWNANLIVVENGIIVNTIFPKTWIDSINNSLFHTYKLHQDKQVFPLPITHAVKRNKLLAVYKTVRTILSMLSRTHYRTTVKPILKGIHPFDLKLDALEKIDFTTITEFNQDNTTDVDIWKIIGFYLIQNIWLTYHNVEIYTKTDLCLHGGSMIKPFIYREEITKKDKDFLNTVVYAYVKNLREFGTYHCKENIMECDSIKFKGEKIDMKNEVGL